MQVITFGKKFFHTFHVNSSEAPIKLPLKALEAEHFAGGLIQFTRRLEAIGLLELAERLPGLGTVDTVDRSGVETGDQQSLLETANEVATWFSRYGWKRLGCRFN